MAAEDGSADGDNSVAEQAARWVARLSSTDATADHWRDFEVWRQASPAHEAAFSELSELWSELKAVRPGEGAGGAGGKSSLIVAFLAIGAGAFAYQSGTLDRWRADHSTGIGEVSRIVLPDGTEAVLNTDTAIALDYSPSGRRIELIRGQAFFTVTPDVSRPFVVESDKLTATALGTRFQVDEQRDQGAEVEVEEGSVEVAAGDRRLRLAAGDSAGRNAAGLLSPVEAGADIEDRTAWRHGRLVFSGRRLDDVLAIIGRYRRGKIFVLDDRIASLRVSGAFDLKDTDGALAALGATLPISVTNLAGAVVLVRAAN